MLDARNRTWRTVLFRAVLALLALGLLVARAEAAEPKPGSMVEVTCKAQADQRYSCYVPKAYDAKKAWPILYCFSPNARGDAFVQRYRKVCEERGWIVVGSMNSKNGPWEPIRAAINAMWADTEARFNLSSSMRYTSGFSGGARVSFAVAATHAANVGGVIAIGAGLPGREQPAKELAIYLTCGETDPNKRELDPLYKALQEAGNPCRYKNFDGGHVMPPVEILEEAVRWLDDLAPAKRAAAFAAGLTNARGLADDGKPLEAYVLLRETLVAYPGVKERRKEATALLKKLERDPAVKPEVAARKLLEATAKWLQKNAEKMARYPHVRQQGEKKLQKIIERFPGTPSAEAAQKRLEALP